MPLAGYYRNELERVDKGSKRLREVMDGLSPAFFIGMLTLDGVLTYANRTALEAVGAELKDVLGKRFEDTVWWSYSEAYRQQLREAIVKAANGETSRFDMNFQDVNGRLVTADFSLSPVFDSKKNVSYLVPSGHDVTERRAAERALRILSACNKSLIHAKDEITLLNEACQLVVDEGYALALVGYAQYDEAKTIKVMAYAGEDQGMFANLVMTWAENDPRGQGANGRCIRTGQVIIYEDIKQEATTYIQGVAEKNGFQGGMALPLSINNKVFATLAIGSRTLFKIDTEEVALLRELADNLAFGISKMRQQQESQRILTAVYRVAEGVSVSTGEEFFEKLMLNMTEALGAQVGIITHLPSIDALSSRSVVAVVDGEIVDNFDIPISGTPCENLSSETPELVIPNNVISQYPRSEGLVAFQAEAYVGRRIEDSFGRPMGQVFVLFRHALEQTSFVSSLLKIFTARVAAEFERQEKERHIHEQASWLDKAHHVVIVRSLDHRILFWNKSAERLYGWSKEEVLGRSIAELFYADPTAFYAATQTVLETGEWRGEITQRCKDGRLLRVEAHWSLASDEQGQAKSIFAINNDITHRK